MDHSKKTNVKTDRLLKVLIIDDDINQLELLKELVSALLPTSLITTSEGPKVDELIIRSCRTPGDRFHIIICDSKLEYVMGYEIIDNELWSLIREKGTLVIANSQFPKVYQKLWAGRYHAFLEKPATVANLRKAIEEAWKHSGESELLFDTV
ncbi:MAG: response regulator [Patescibacteria group bacterium]